jgi:hypothetical protein
VLLNRPLAKQIGMAAADKVRMHFGWKPVAQAFLEACDLGIMRWNRTGGKEGVVGSF